ncbi:MAG: OsmC family protein [Vicinamibacterales bacterium]
MSQDTIRVALDRNVKAVSLRPSVGQGTAVTKVTWREGLTCDVEEGPWKLVVGMTEKYGGSNAGPNPGVYGRTALGSCLAIGYMMWASRLGVPIRSLEVEVHADYDVRGELGVDENVRPGYSRMRYVVTIDAGAPDQDVMQLLETAERYSSYLDDFANSVPVEREVRIVSGQAG